MACICSGRFRFAAATSAVFNRGLYGSHLAASESHTGVKLIRVRIGDTQSVFGAKFGSREFRCAA